MKYMYKYQEWIGLEWQLLSLTSKFLVGYGLLMLITLILTYIWSLNDHRFIREVGIWVKPMKFIATTALIGLTSIV